MFVPSWPTLRPAYLLGRGSPSTPPFPLGASHGTYFYTARNGIYHLFRALGPQGSGVVLVPEYHHGNEVRAIRAAGFALRFYRVRRNLQPDLDDLARLLKARPRALLAIHFLGWPQPIEEIAALCRENGVVLVEDCALSLFSQLGGQPLGTFGDYSIFCLYKTLPVPNGGILVQNWEVFESLEQMKLGSCSLPSVAGRTAELMLGWMRGSLNGLGDSLAALKAAVGRALTAGGIERVPVGDTGFRLEGVNLGMSSLSAHLLRRFDYAAVPRKRRENFLMLRGKLEGFATLVRDDLEEGVCPLFFPVLVRDKQSAARALAERGVQTVEFWNYGDPEADAAASSEVRFLRKHVLELPVHQELSPAQVAYVADQVLDLRLRL